MKVPWLPLWGVRKWLSEVCPLSMLSKVKHMKSDEAYKEYYRQWFRLQRVADTKRRYENQHTLPF